MDEKVASIRLSNQKLLPLITRYVSGGLCCNAEELLLLRLE